MNLSSERTVVVTGANSGVGMEAAAQFAQQGFGRVVVTARSDAKAQQASVNLSERVGSNVFEPLTLDLDDLASVHAAADALANGGGDLIDVLVLNAGLPPGTELRRTSEGIEATVSATLTGHHLLTMRLLDADAFTTDARIIIAGSEAARGDVPMMNPLNIDELAATHFSNDLEQAVTAVMQMASPLKFHPNNQYATTKVFAAWWAAELATRLPDQMTVNAVSPGNTPATGAADKMSAFTRRILVPVMKLMPGMSQTIAEAASRYVEAAAFPVDVNGQFFASRPKKMVGPMVRNEPKHLNNPAAQQALWKVTDRLVGRAGNN